MERDDHVSDFTQNEDAEPIEKEFRTEGKFEQTCHYTCDSNPVFTLCCGRGLSNPFSDEKHQ